MPLRITTSYKLFTLYGSCNVNAYGFFIALGIVISMYVMQRNKKFAQLGLDHTFNTIITISICAGVIGGRLLAIISEPHIYEFWYDWFALWNGGFSALGSILGVIIITPLYLKKINVPIMPLFDLSAIYAPLFQSIARLGCLFAGCCHGTVTTSVFSIIYTNPETIALYGVYVHPTQLYSSLTLLCIFLFMYFYAQHALKKPGLLFCTYLMLSCTERFFIDFLRADRIVIDSSSLSFHQYVALIIFGASLIAFISLSFCCSKINNNSHFH